MTAKVEARDLLLYEAIAKWNWINVESWKEKLEGEAPHLAIKSFVLPRNFLISTTVISICIFLVSFFALIFVPDVTTGS